MLVEEVKKLVKQKCPDCDKEIDIPSDVVEGEILDCPCCGLELEYKKGYLVELTLDGVDYGE